MIDFTYRQPTKINFGFGYTQKLGEIAGQYGKTAMLVSVAPTAFMAEKYEHAIALLKGAGLRAIHFDALSPDPCTTDIGKGIAMAFQEKADVIVAMGGGSAIDAAKIISLCATHGSADWDRFFTEFRNFRATHPLPYGSKLPLIAIPTTAGTGSECTQAAVVTNAATGLKTTIHHQGLFAQECIVDPEQTMSMPFSLTAATAFDAFSHAFESYLSPYASPLTQMMSLDSLRRIIKYLPLLKEKNDPEYRQQLSLANTYAGICLSNAAGNAPHPLGETIGSICKISHGETLAIVYPAFIRCTWKMHTQQFATVARIFDGSLAQENDETAAQALYDSIVHFLKEIGLLRKLSYYHPTEEQKEQILHRPLWDSLWMADKATLLQILEESF